MADLDRLISIAEHLAASKLPAHARDVLDAIAEIERLRPQNAGEDVGSAAARDVLTERRRQVGVEGWTPDHDDEHDKCEMAIAAACYATARSPVGVEREWVYPGSPKGWPWHYSWWKPGFYRHNLVKAGALIIAEIERWDRAEARRLQAEKCGLERGTDAGLAEIPSPAQ